MKVTRRSFISKSVSIGLGGSLIAASGLPSVSSASPLRPNVSRIGEKHLFVDNDNIEQIYRAYRKVHAASKLEKPVLEADRPWEQGEIYDGKLDRRVYIYGTVLKDEAGGFRMWYNRLRDNYYATSRDGVNWERPNLRLLGENNMIDLFDFHSPSFILDERESDPAKRFKAVGSAKGKGYCAAYSADGVNWTLYPKNPILKSSDTITLSQDPVTGEYLAFHKVNNDPRVKGRQVFLSVSRDMQNWSDPVPVMVTDALDHVEARRLPGGTHSEFYNMSAFPYGNQWLGMVTHFRRTGEPRVKKYDSGGHRQSFSDGPIDVQLVHSRDGRHWKRCSDRSPVIALGPYAYDSGSILGLCNSPVISGDEVWMYYTAMTTTHGGALPEKEMSIARASWRTDGFVSMRADDEEGVIQTHPLIPEGDTLFVNSNVAAGTLTIEVLDAQGRELKGYGKYTISKKDGLKIPVVWNNSQKLPVGEPIKFRFRLKKGDLFSYTIS